MLQLFGKILRYYICSLKKIQFTVWLYTLAAMVFWGLSFIWTSLLFKYYQPITIIFIRLIISSVFLFLAVFLTHSFTPIRKKDIPVIILAAVFNPFLYFLMENYGLMYTSPAIAAVIIGTIPVFAPITGYLAFKEKLRWYNIAGILLSFTGVVMMLITPDFKISVNPAGLLFLAGAVMASLIYAVGLKKLTARYSSVTIISWQNLTGIFLFLPFFLIFEMKDAIRVPLNTTIITSFLFLSILASSLSYVFYVKAIKNLGIGKASIFTNLIPVFTAIASFFLLGELFTFQKIAGILIVIFGVVISQISSREK